MTNKDLRTYINYLETNCPEEIVRVKKEVDSAWEITALVRRLEEEGRFPVVFFERVRGSAMPVITNLFASRTRLAAAFETTIEQAVREYIDREANLTKPVLVSSGPVKEVILEGEKADLSKFPIVTHCEKDSGPFITPGVGIVKDPDTGVRNAGIYRMELKGPRKLGLGLDPSCHAAHIVRKNDKEGRPTPIVVALGHHPAMCLGSQSKVSLEVDEFEVMGGLLAQPLAIARCESVELEVPAYAEIAIEGILPAGVREPEGPFGEFTWYYGPGHPNPVIEVTAITHRKDAIFHDLFSGHLDHNYCGLLGRESVLFKKIREVVPSLKQAILAESGCCRFSCYIQIQKEYDGQGKNAALAALAADPFIKMAVVVDDDVNVTNEREVLWAVTTRTQPDRDFFFVPESYVCVLSPTGYTVKSRSERGGMDTKLGIDATKPLGLPFPERCDVKRELWEKLNLGDYL